MKKRGVMEDYMAYILIAVAVLVLGGIIAWVLKGQGGNLIETLKGMFTGR